MTPFAPESTRCGRVWWTLALLCPLVACSPSPDSTEEFGPAGGLVRGPCELDIPRDALNSSVRFDIKAYPNPSDMARDTAPVIPFPELVVSVGCFYDLVAVPLKAGQGVYIRPQANSVSLWPGFEGVSNDLFADGRDVLSFLLVLYRAEPFGAWQAGSILGQPEYYERNRRGFELYQSRKATRLGYAFVAAGLYFSPDLPATLTVDEGAPIPYALGLGGTLASSDPPLLLRWTDDWVKRPRVFRDLPAVAALTGELPFDEAWRDKGEIEITIQAQYAGSLPFDRWDITIAEFYSRPMKVTIVASPPRIEAGPANITVDEGQSATFAVTAGGSRPLTYQWRRNGADIAGATEASYTTPATTVADNGAIYSVVVTNARGATLSDPATLTVRIADGPPVIRRDPRPVTVAAGQPATFDVVATGALPLSYEWLRNGVSIAGATASSYTLATTSLADDGAQFAVRVSNAVDPGGIITTAARLTVLSDVCPVPPRDVPFDTTAPPAVAVPAATYDTNLLIDPDFEQSVRVGPSPTGFGYWRFDESVSVPAQQGIEPRRGNRMLHLVGTNRDTATLGGASTGAEQVQLVDVSALAADIDADGVRVSASAWFSRVAGCLETDDAFGVVIMAFDGPPTTFGARWTNGVNAAVAQGRTRDEADMTGVDGWLRHRTASFRHNRPEDRVGDVFQWRRADVTADLPPGTRFLAIVVYASENVKNDTAFPELHGHYVDEAEVRLTPRP